MTTKHSTKLKNAVRAMLKSGLASPAEIARSTGLSRQLVRYWTLDIDWRSARGGLIKRHLSRLTD